MHIGYIVSIEQKFMGVSNIYEQEEHILIQLSMQ